MNNSNHYNLPPACENGDRLFKTRDVCCLPWNPDRRVNQELGKCMPWNDCIPDVVSDADDLQICAPSCSKDRQTCPPAPVKDPTTGYDLQGVSECNVLSYDWRSGKFPEGTIANCSIRSPYKHYFTGAGAYDACKELSGDDQAKCNQCNQMIHFDVPSSQSRQGDELLYLTGDDGATARSHHTSEISVDTDFKECLKEPNAATWIRDFVKGPEKGGTNPVMRKGTVYEVTNGGLSNQLRCVRTPDHPTTPACSAVDCASFNNDAQSSNYCLKEGNEDCCRLAIMEPQYPDFGRMFPSEWSTIGI